jgi:hypothetical protein
VIVDWSRTDGVIIFLHPEYAVLLYSILVDDTTFIMGIYPFWKPVTHNSGAKSMEIIPDGIILNNYEIGLQDCYNRSSEGVKKKSTIHSTTVQM